MRNIMLIVCAFLLGVSSLIGGLAFADGDYSFRIVAKVGDPAPGGGFYGPGLEPNDINDWGTVMFVTDLDTGGQGLFLSRKGVNSQIVRSGLPAPGTGYNFGSFGSLTPSGLNDVGDMAFGFSLDLPPLYDSGIKEMLRKEPATILLLGYGLLDSLDSQGNLRSGQLTCLFHKVQ